MVVTNTQVRPHWTSPEGREGSARQAGLSQPPFFLRRHVRRRVRRALLTRYFRYCNAYVMRSAKRVLSCGINARTRCVHEPAFGAGRQVAWRIRLACSPVEAWGAWQRSRFAERAQRSLNVGQRTRQKNLATRKRTSFGNCVRPCGPHRKNLIFLDVLNFNGFLT